MTLHPLPEWEIPEQTAQIARASFPKGNMYMKMYDELGVLYQDLEFAALFPTRCGQSAMSPGKLALITVMQFAEGLSDRQTADAVRSRIDWKYALGLELTDSGFDCSVLSEFRTRLCEYELTNKLLDLMLEKFQEKKLIKHRSKQRTDSTQVVAAIRQVNRLELVGETLRAALNEIAIIEPEWLKAIISDEWFERYSWRFDNYRLPKNKYALRAGVEGTISQAVRRFDLRRTRYFGLAKTHLQQIATACAMNLSRFFAWSNHLTPAHTRTSSFARLRVHAA